MKENPIFVAAMLTLAVRACHATPALKEAMADYARGDFEYAAGSLLAAALDEIPEAQQLLGFMYAIGGEFYPGVERNMAVAGWWLELAARKGAPAARYLHDALARRGPAEVYADVVYCFDRMKGTDEPMTGADEPLKRLMIAPTGS